jgi:hypothetical protein
VKFQERRREFLQIERVGKEFKNLRPGARQQEFGVKVKSPQATPRVVSFLRAWHFFGSTLFCGQSQRSEESLLSFLTENRSSLRSE